MCAMLVEREIKKGPSTARTKKLKARYIDATLCLDIERVRYYTESWKKTDSQPVEIRRALALKHVLENLTPTIFEDELLVGHQQKYLRGAQVYPEYGAKWLLRETEKAKLAEEKFWEIGRMPERADNFVVYEMSLEDRTELVEIANYWADKSVTDLTDEYQETLYPDRYEKFMRLASEVVTTNIQSNFPHEAPHVLDHETLMKKGLNKIIEEIDGKIEQLDATIIDELKKVIFYRAARIVCEAAITFAKRYANEARRLAQEASPKRAKELNEIAEICEWVPANPPRSFREAIQFVWFSFLIRSLEGELAPSFGRFDQYLYPYYKKGVESDSEVIELIECLRLKCSESELFFPYGWEGVYSGTRFQNLCIGGVRRDGEDASNELTHLVLDATICMQTIQPSLSLRLNTKTNDEVLLKAIECIKTGIGMPAILSDNVAMAHLFSHAEPVSLEEARDWCVVGCLEISLAPNHYKLLGGYYNQAKILELALNNGVNPMSGNQIGPATGDVENMSYEEIYDAYEKQLQYVFDLTHERRACVSYMHAQVAPPIWLAVGTGDCLERGIGIPWGARHLEEWSNTSVGLIDVANALAAIKYNVFDRKLFTMKELKEALAANFEGYEEFHRLCREAPKYGNGDEYVDSIAAAVYRDHAEAAQRCTAPYGLPYLSSAISVTTHPGFGAACGALPSGRVAGRTLCDGSVSAFPGDDVKGPTALGASVCRIDHVPWMMMQLNVKFHPSALAGADGARKFSTFVRTLAENGCYHQQFNVVSKEMLIDAQQHPEKYKDLIVRVAGFSARWIELAKPVQDEIIGRTEYETL